MVEHNQSIAIQKPKNAINVPATLNPDLPNAISSFELFEIDYRNDFQLFDEPEHPGYFLRPFAWQGGKELFDGTEAGCGSIENDLSHGEMLTCE
jgi:hypothetical protein